MPRPKVVKGRFVKKRVSVSPASVSTAVKRQRAAADENEELQCLICCMLVVDAVQVRCCGALHCRACISKCTTCPMCRQPVNADTIIPDVRCERFSAAAIRPCAYAEEGCAFKANRSSVAAHEELCDYVPRNVLRQNIQKVERDMREQSLAHTTERQALLKCALGPEPAKNALKVLYNLPAADAVFEIDREAAKGRSHVVMNFAGGTFVTVHECNHNVAVWAIKSQPVFVFGPPPRPLAPPDRIHASILHPYDVCLSKTIRIISSDFDFKQQAGFENFMTSKQLDEHCINGKYYMAWHAR